MVGTLERRVERLEQSGLGGGGEDCPRCANTVIVRTRNLTRSGDVSISVTKNGFRFSPEAARAFYEEEQPGDICPVCEKRRRRVTVSWSAESLRG